LKSVSLKNQRNFILCSDENQHTVLHVAANKSRTDVVEYLCSLPEKDDLLFAKDNRGWTALHCSSNQKIAQLLVESITPERKRDFTLSVTNHQCTALHVAASNGRTDVVEYLCSLPVKLELVLAKKDHGWTALHGSSNQKIAQSLVESLAPQKQIHFILSVTKNKATALHVAANKGRTDVVEYLCSLPGKDELVFAKDSFGCTALHHSFNQNIAQSLVKSIKPHKQRYFVYMVNHKKSTGLHIAAENGKVDVTKYLCNLYPNNDELILKKGDYGNTALHVSKTGEIARILLESVTKAQQATILLASNKFQCTALHEAASSGKNDVVEYLCAVYPTSDELILKNDSSGRTALYYIDDGNTAEMVFKSATEDGRAKLLSAVDRDGQTLLHRAAKLGKKKTILVEQHYTILKISMQPKLF